MDSIKQALFLQMKTQSCLTIPNGRQQKRKHNNIVKLIKGGDFVMEEMDMREEYDIKALNPRKNPYAKKIKKPVTMNMSVTTIEYFKAMSDESGIPYQVLMNYYLDDCVKQKKKLQFVKGDESARQGI